MQSSTFCIFVLNSFLFRDTAKHEEGGAGAGDAEQAAGGRRGVVEAAGARISNVNQNQIPAKQLLQLQATIIS